jgi:hypothetical protein
MLIFLVSLAGNFIGGFGVMWMDRHYRKRHEMLKVDEQ